MHSPIYVGINAHYKSSKGINWLNIIIALGIGDASDKLTCAEI